MNRPRRQVRRVQRHLRLELVRREIASSFSESESEHSHNEHERHENGAGAGGASEGPSDSSDEEDHMIDNDNDNDNNDNGNVNVDEQNHVYVAVPPNDEANIIGDADVDRNQYVFENLKRWSLKGVSYSKVDELLKILSPMYPNLPKSYRSLLETPRDVGLDVIGEHEFWYKGINRNLNERVTDEYFESHDCVEMDVFIDGFTPFKSVPNSFWAILGCLVDEDEPFIIQIARGRGHPTLEDFFELFVEETNELQENGFEYHGGRCPFKIRLYFADAAGRSFIKCVIGHSGHHGCERCDVVGYRYRRVYEVFTGPNGRPRTDVTFAERRDRRHHTGDSPLEALGVNMISQIPLDGLHLVDEGVVKRFVKQIWGRNKIKRGAVGPQSKLVVQRLIPRLRSCIPSEFNRRTRSFLDLAYFKATEFRRIVLYDGVRLFKHLDHNLYLNFLQLHCAISILSNPEHIHSEVMLQMAERLLNMFVATAQRNFGTQFVVYNIHSIKHLPDECRKHGTIVQFSAYKYESFFAVLRNTLRSGSYPIQQLRNRDSERAGHFLHVKRERLQENEVKLLQQESFQFGDEGTLYRKLQTSKFCLGTNRRDCCFLANTGEVVCISKIIHSHNGNVVLKGRKFAFKDDYYHEPMPSSMLNIFKVSHLVGIEQRWQFQNIEMKCMLFPSDRNNEFVCLPLYCVIGLEDGAVFSAPSKWINADRTRCYYPKASKQQNPKRMVLSQTELPATICEDKWYTYKDFNILHHYDKFMVAEKAVRLASKGKTIDSNVETDLEKGRNRRKPKRFRAGPSSDSELETEREDNPSPKSKVKSRKRPVIATSEDEENYMDQGKDANELERLIEKQRKEIAEKKKESKISKKSESTVLVSLERSPNVLHRTDRSTDNPSPKSKVKSRKRPVIATSEDEENYMDQGKDANELERLIEKQRKEIAEKKKESKINKKSESTVLVSLERSPNVLHRTDRSTDNPSPKSKVKSRIRPVIASSEDEENYMDQGKDDDELERLIEKQRKEIAEKKKESKISKKSESTVLVSLERSPNVLHRTDRSTDHVDAASPVTSKSPAVKRSLFNVVPTTRKPNGSSPFKVTALNSMSKDRNEDTETSVLSFDGGNAIPYVSKNIAKDASTSSGVSSYIKGYKGNKVFTFGEAKSFEAAAPALEHVLSSLLNGFHEQSSKLDFISYNLQTLVSKVCPGEEVIERPEGMKPLRLSTFESMQEMNEFLDDKKHRRALVAMMSSKIKGISEIEASARTILAELFSNDGARLVSWGGTNNLKFKFQDSNLCLVLESAILKRFPDASLDKAYSATKKWFNTSFQRTSAK